MANPKKTNKVQDIENQVVLTKAQAADIPTVVKDISDLQVKVQSVLSSLGASLASKVQSFTELDKAVELREQRLTELHGIESELLSLESVKALRIQEKESADRELEIRNQTWEEEENERDKQWNREEEEHAYKSQLQRQRAIDEFNNEIERNKRAELIRQEELKRQWAERENALKAQENEVKALKGQAATFEARVKNEVSRAEAILKNSLEREHKHTLALLTKEEETNNRIHQGEITSLQATIDSLKNQVADLSTQLAAARADAKDIASTALNSASQRQVADALTNVVNRDNAVTKK